MLKTGGRGHLKGFALSSWICRMTPILRLDAAESEHEARFPAPRPCLTQKQYGGRKAEETEITHLSWRQSL